MNLKRHGITYLQRDEIPPCNWLKQRVENYARQVAELTQFPVGGSLEHLVDQLGGKIHYEHLDEWFTEDGSIFVHGRFDFDVVLSYYTSPLRDRFTIAHELGHYFLHANQGEKQIVAYRAGSTRIEWEANWFAASLLMPEERFREFCTKTDSLVEIADHFLVSQDAVEVRKKALQHGN